MIKFMMKILIKIRFDFNKHHLTSMVPVILLISTLAPESVRILFILMPKNFKIIKISVYKYFNHTMIKMIIKPEYKESQ